MQTRFHSPSAASLPRIRKLLNPRTALMMPNTGSDQGPAGSLAVKEDDEITLKLAMLVEGQCEGLASTEAAQKFGYTRQRYYQILEQFKNYGAAGLKSHKTGPKSHSRRTHEVIRQIIRYRFLDPNVSPEVMAQKLNQNGFPIAIRSVERVLAEYGLQKKTSPRLSRDRPGRGRNSSNQR